MKSLLLPIVICLSLTAESTASSLPEIDYHAHLTPDFDIHQALDLAKERQVKLGIVEHPGPRYTAMTDDASLQTYVQHLRQFPVCIGLQPVEPGWRELFSPEILGQVDYILMDALEIPNGDGTFFRIWEANTVVDDVDAFMDRYVDFYVQILEEESIDILASPTFLPDSLRDRYHELWTESRMERLIEAAVRNGVAIEINSMYRIPSPEFVSVAKKMGAKFSFGTNGRTTDTVANLEYSLGVANRCGLTESDFFHLPRE